MPDRARLLCGSCVLLAILFLPGTGEKIGELTALRLLPVEGFADPGRSFSVVMAGLGVPGGLAVALCGLAGHLLAAAYVGTSRDSHLFRPALLHPSAILLSLCGFGFALLAIFGMASTLKHLIEKDSAAQVPLLGLALMIAALTIPGFAAAALFFFSPLFLAAPTAMLRQHMLSFYLITCIPPLAVLATAAFASGAQMAASAPAPLVMALGGPGLAGLSARVSLGDRWRLPAILGMAGAGIISTGGWPPLFDLLLASFLCSVILTGLGARNLSLAATLALPALVFLL